MMRCAIARSTAIYKPVNVRSQKRTATKAMPIASKKVALARAVDHHQPWTQNCHNVSSNRQRKESGPLTSIRNYKSWSASESLDQLRGFVKNEKLYTFLKDSITMLKPSRVKLCDGSNEENEELINGLVQAGTLIPLNPKKRPNSFAAFSEPSDVARVEERTFICSHTKEDAGPTNNWTDPTAMRETMTKLYHNAMNGRTMYIVPFSMGPIGSPLSKIGVQITDSRYVVVSMRVMTRMGGEILKLLEPGQDFVQCLHSVGAPLTKGQPDKPWPSDPRNKYIVHFPDDLSVWSYGSGYGGNSLLGKKCFALRLASVMARDQGWLAEHMLILGLTSPTGKKSYVTAAFPSACGKTNLAMLLPSLEGWKVETVGDDICWMKFGSDGRLYAINPEAGFFGVAPGTSWKSNPNAMKTVSKNAIFTNVALTPDNDVWWEGLTKDRPPKLKNWLRRDLYHGSLYEGDDAAHPNSRFTVPASQCPVIDPNWESPTGVPIDAIIFGGRRASTVPLVYQSFDWDHGTYLGANVNSETTAAAEGAKGVLRPDPFAMKPFCGYNMGDYFNHWLSIGARGRPEALPKIFHVNWFRKGSDGKFLWPGYSQNIRVLKWIFDRINNPNLQANALKTPIGYVPTVESFDLSGINDDGNNVTSDTLRELLKVDSKEWLSELDKYKEYHSTFGDRFPDKLKVQHNNLGARLQQDINSHTI